MDLPPIQEAAARAESSTAPGRSMGCPMSRHLFPALLVLALICAVALRTAQRPSEPLSEERIRGHVESEDAQRLLPALDRYLDEFQAPRNRWFAAGVLMRLQQHLRAVEIVFDDPDLATDPETPRRFAHEALYALGWEDEERTVPTSYMPQCLVTLVEGRDAWAEESLAALASSAELHAATGVYFPAFRQSGTRPMEVIGRAFRARGEEPFLVAAAMGTLAEQPYPERDADIRLLIQVLTEERWRVHNRDVWGVAAFVLGRSTEAEAIAALRQARSRVKDPTSEAGELEVAILTNGLLAAGFFDEREIVERLVYRDPPAPLLSQWYVDALLASFQRTADETARRSLRRVWEERGYYLSHQRWRTARGLLLQDSLPDPKAPWLTVMLQDLEAPGAPLVSHALAAGYRLRVGQPGSRERLVEILRASAGTLESDEPDTDARLAGAQPYMEALRALWLYGGPTHGQD